LNPELCGFTLNRTAVRPLLSFGGALALSGVAAVLLVNLEKAVLTRVTTVSVLAYYSIASTFANMATLFGLAMGQSLMPAFSQLLTPERHEQLKNLYLRAIRVNLFALVPMLAVLCVIARPFFTLWAGEDFGRESTGPFYVLLVGLFFNLNAYTPAGLLLAAGRTDVIAKLYWIELFPYIAVTAFLTTRFGALGAAASWSLRVIVDAVIYAWLSEKFGGVRFGARALLPTFVLGTLVLAPAVVLAVFYQTSPVFLPVVLIVGLILYVLIVWKRVFDNGEKDWVSAKMNLIISMGRKQRKNA
jgi:O-antigen/teichoic acid export membrane protein